MQRSRAPKVPKTDKNRILGYYVRDDGELMLEIRPGEFVNETAARRGFVEPNVLSDIHRIKGRLQGLRRRQAKSKKPRY